MGNESPSKVVYEGEVLITEFDPDNLGELDEILEDFVDLEEGEELYVSPGSGDALEVKKMRKRE